MEKKNLFYRKVNKANRKEMIEFLSNHFRYSTMNSWNNSTSYANNLKIHRVIPGELQDKVYDLMNADEFYDEINDRIYEFDCEHDHTYQAGFNGRSGGYLVLYVEKENNRISSFFSGRSIDQDEDFSDFEMYQLKNRVNLVQSFDELCDDIVNITIEQAKSFNAVEKTISVPKKITVMEAV